MVSGQLYLLDNLCYAGPRTGTRAALSAAIGNRVNWIGDGGLGSTPPQLRNDLRQLQLRRHPRVVPAPPLSLIASLSEQLVSTI